MTLTSPAAGEFGTVSIWSGTSYGLLFRVGGTAAAPTSAAWPANNQAYAIPFYISAPFTIVEMFAWMGTSPGTTNYDLGIYREDFKLIASLGATASVNTTDATLPVGGGTVNVGTLQRGRYYMAMSAASTGLTNRATVQANGLLRAIGMFQMATAHPLPATFVPATMSTSTFFPAFGVTGITNIL